MQYEGLTFSPLTEQDIPALVPIMTRAFDDDIQQFYGTAHGGPDGYDDGSFLRKWGLSAHAHAYAIAKDGQPIGAMILFIDAAKKQGHLGCLFIDSTLHGKGCGTTAWRFAEHTFPQVRTWFTETPARSYRNHCFYINKCGFQVTHIMDAHDMQQAQFCLKKELAADGAQDV